jgi:hypothetical protein
MPEEIRNVGAKTEIVLQRQKKKKKKKKEREEEEVGFSLSFIYLFFFFLVKQIALELEGHLGLELTTKRQQL